MKKNGTLINSIKGIKVKIEVVNGTGRGEGKEYINLIFSDKPSETIRDDMKEHNFKFYKVNGTWSAYKTDKTMEFAYSLIKENNIKAEVEAKVEAEVEPTKPQKTARGSSRKESDVLVTVIIDGKKVTGAPKDIKTILNA